MNRLGILLCAFALACGDATSPAGDASADATKDTAPDVVQSGPIACGSTTCQGTDLCVIPCCGGATPLCDPFEDDAGTCPDGDTPSTQCPNAGTPAGCMPPPCTPAPRFCAPATGGYCNPSNETYHLTGRDCIEVCS